LVSQAPHFLDADLPTFICSAQPRGGILVQNASTGQTRLTIPTSSPVTCLRPLPGPGIERGLYFLADGSLQLWRL